MVQVLLAALAMYGCAQLLPGYALAYPTPPWLAAVPGALGVGLAALGVWQFRRASTTVDPRDPGKSSALVTGGIYRWTRNPMYLGMLLVLVGWAVYLANLPALLGLPGFVLYMTRFQILPEERHMRRTFGAAFDRYRLRVRRWL